MITQFLMDFVRGILVNLMVGIGALWPAANIDQFLTTINIPASTIGTVLAIFYQPIGWGIQITLLTGYLAFWLGSTFVKFFMNLWRR